MFIWVNFVLFGTTVTRFEYKVLWTQMTHFVQNGKKKVKITFSKLVSTEARCMWRLCYASCLEETTIHTRCLMVSTNQADPRCFYFRISWILMGRHWFHFFLSSPFSAGPQKPWTLTASKITYEKFDQKFRFFIKE